ncbi:Pre-mRNA splicing factor PRP21-like protein [Penicillium cf. griseofulvum]|uniref:Pre-mRNA splicing factor PRP21-like protein n=1 Tax=Penicillium cf. griseofulvum TaxID=2972120 RepID=A0A9W9T5U1_9EURO|nr:Pre-mRNA splicing factor PRP21-like protein [Penicillium cf. griseofulvum]KAJ5421743.1 Pre-mRNA splicing factor PRP21-like protein [Penicillium cf. griseofulvum]KAJ5427935.1 Pre-mRNA splicing factor PRP21-like protein [Penicillium cf. griseofulvum]
MEPSNGTTPRPEGSEGVLKPPEGMVLPPKDIRKAIETTASYVVRHKGTFEDRIRQKEKNNYKFSFLTPGDAYEPYYQWYTAEYKAGRVAGLAGRAGESVAAAEPEKPKGPPQPSSFHFSARMPIINAQDLDVVKLTALFVAKRGKSFMTALSQREARNFQFDFLRPQHSLYQFFTRLVDQYTILLRAEGIDEATSVTKRIAELEQNAKNKFNVMERAKQRAEWVKYQRKQKQEKEEQSEQERIEYAQIDWHDFVVVETVEFTEHDDHADLPPPTSANDLQSASLEQRAALSLNTRRIEEAMPTGLDEPVYYNAYPVQPPPMHAPQPSASPYPASPYHPAGQYPNAEEEQRIRERTQSRDQAAAAQAAAVPGQQPMRIRSDYVPRAQARRQQPQMAICPYCNQKVPFPELDEHIRIELLDPRWKEQRAKAEARSATTNLSTVDVVNNLKRLASQRSDVFDPAPVDLEEDRRKRMAMGVDGSAGPQNPNAGPPGVHNPQSMNIEDQLRHIHQLAKK